jgi:hypothetical protein
MNIVEILALLLAIGAALDLVVSIPAKSKIIKWAEKSYNLTAPADTLFEYFDKRAGTKLVSWKAFRFSFYLSTIAFFTMFAAVFAIDGVQALSDFSQSLSSTSPLILIILPITAIIFIVGDFLSFAQTRLFIRAVNTLSDRYVTMIMLVGDILSSVLIFVAFAALARLTCYILLVVFLYTQPVRSSITYIPSVATSALLSQGYSRDKLAKLADNSDVVKLLMLSDDPSNFKKNLKQISVLYRRIYLPDKVFAKSIVSEASVVCLDYEQSTALTNSDLSLALRQSVEISISAMATDGKYPSRDKRKTITDTAAVQAIKARRSWAKCKIPAIKTERSVNLRSLFSEISPTDLYLASFGLTLNDMLESIPRKFSEYKTVDPANDIIAFAGNAILASSTGLLSIGGTNGEKMQAINVTNEISADTFVTEHTPLPFPTMAASSMVASIIFTVFLSMRLVARVATAGFHIMQSSLKIIDGEKYVFTYISLISIASTAGVLCAMELIRVGWRALIGV